MRVLNRSADRFQQALEGGQVTDEAIRELLATSEQLSTLRVAGPRPDPAFVATLRVRLMDEVASLPTPSPAAARAAAAQRAATRSAPVVVVLGRGLPRAVAGAVASALLVAGIVGIASRGAVPGDSLYPVKSWLDSVAVRLATSDLDRGQTYLQQAQEHLSDARDLADRHDPASAAEINVALEAATDSIRAAQRSLDAAFTETGNPQALLAMRDFTARVLPQLDALRDEVPSGSLADLATLEALLRDTQQATIRRMAACGAPCSDLLSSTLGSSSLPSSAATTAPSGPTSSGGTGLTVPSSPLTNAPGGGGPAPGVSAGGGGLGVGASGGGAGASTRGASIGGPTISASAPVPGGTAKVPLPSATLSSGTLGATVPSSTLGPITLPGATLTLP
jgi:uncharacterized membrane protein YgcG